MLNLRRVHGVRISSLVCALVFVVGALVPRRMQSRVLRAETGLHEEIDAAARNLEERVIQWRRLLHEHPELGNREFRTSRMLARHLRKLGYKVQTGVAHTGVVGVLEGGQARRRVFFLRYAPIWMRCRWWSAPDLPYASKARGEYEGNEVGVMHACGHDNHMAILMGAAQILAGLREELSGTVKIIFQPAEEGPPRGENGGAKMMIEEGVLQNPDVDAIFGLHISQGDAVGQVGYRPRGTMASAQRFDVDIQGRQTHGAQPWGGVDPIVVGAHIVTALQTIVSRQVDITRSPAVVSVGSFHAGVRNNIIPDTARMSGTIRTFDPRVRRQIHQKIETTVRSVAATFGAEASVTIDPGVPVTYNDPQLTQAMVPSVGTHLRRAPGTSEPPGHRCRGLCLLSGADPRFLLLHRRTTTRCTSREGNPQPLAVVLCG